MNNQGTVLSHCNICHHETNHELAHKICHKRQVPFDFGSVDFETIWEVLQCKGCEEVTLVRYDWNSESMGEECKKVCFPPRVSRRKPSWMDRDQLTIPAEYSELLDEVYVALHADSRRLAAMGIRALIDAIIRTHVGEQNNFKEGISALYSKQFISSRGQEIIENAVEVGHAANHRGYKPSVKDMGIFMDIVENLIHNILLHEQSSKIKSRIPKRVRQQ
ncbi:MAG: DUF4145 domain-containing protein [Magnetococcales bacterium]|nr:DUF4145 domain-containing protein [Magnetococcales bacterium]MBF0152069.1 DUF4145 domain-containing protein [Magnetococcales bacterium]